MRSPTLPNHYRAEATDPQTAFADDEVLVTLSGDTAVGCPVVTPTVERRSEINRPAPEAGFTIVESWDEREQLVCIERRPAEGDRGRAEAGRSDLSGC